MIGVWVDVYVCVYEGCRFVKQGDCDSDGSAGHDWAAMMDASWMVISKSFQGRHDKALYVHVCVCICVCGRKCLLYVPAKGETSPRLSFFLVKLGIKKCSLFMSNIVNVFIS